MHRVPGILMAATAGLVAVTHASAQGSDDCATAMPITGVGSFAFDNNFATTGAQGQTESACNFAGGPGIQQDVWFTWTATFTDSIAQVTSCGLAFIDIKIAVYAGAGCPTGPAIGCDDNSCSAQPVVTFACTQGQQYTIQLGLHPGSLPGGVGGFFIAPGVVPCTFVNGPDVQVGYVVDVQNTTAAAGIDAISLGTDACNFGNATVAWQGGNNHHPVIGSTLYRYKVVNGAGRFEELGMSWLKHASFALNDSDCCNCQGGIGSGLGVGCSDTYDASSNGSQTSLGPRWQVNAHTGVFTYPPANPAWAGSQARRLEVAVSDLEVTGGASTTRFFGESTYVTQDDAVAGNGDNNASYIGLTCAGGPTDFSFAKTGATQRGLQAIRAWPLVEPGVTLTDVHVPNDGLFVVGSHATSLGGGVYHYEYAVLNMNSDRNGGSFTVDLPAGAMVTNIGFHDVGYHDGDGPGDVNFSGLDWTPSISASSITWSCETEAQNASANALRWSSTYNFRFDANVFPATGLVSLGLWKAGAPASVVAAAEVPARGNSTFSYCFGDGSGTACPCGNNSAAGSQAGCLNSTGTAGQLSFNGTASISADTFQIVGSHMPATSTALYFQGSAMVLGGLGATFGDGLRCAGGTTVRLGTKTNAGGASQYPSGTDVPISVRGSNASGAVRTYQCWYRNIASFCTGATFNLTNAVETTWQP